MPFVRAEKMGGHACRCEQIQRLVEVSPECPPIFSEMPVLPSLCFFVRRDGFSSPDTPAGKPAAGQKACPTKTRNTGRNACATLLLFFLISAAQKDHAKPDYKLTNMPCPAA